MEVIEMQTKTYTADIYMAGSYVDAKRICAEFCEVGLCVNLQKVDYIYKYGQQGGIKIGLINYPRFPASPKQIISIAKELGGKLMKELQQGSFSIVTPDKTYYYSRRGDE